ncbi:MAG TPA: helix-turn-helix domain-containing protein [Ktedonobacteraceae bacterium]
MSSSSKGITLEQISHDHSGLTIRNTSDTQLYDSSNGTATHTGSTTKTYDILNWLIQTLSSAHSLDALLHSLGDLTRQVMQMDLCIVMLVDPTSGSLTMRAASPDLSDYKISFAPIESNRIPWKKLQVFSSEGQLPILTQHEQEQLNPLKQVQYETLLVVPLVVGNENLGLLNCYSSKNRDYTLEDQVLLRAITSHGALAIQNRQLAYTPGRNELGPYIKSFFDDLLSEKPEMEESLRGRANYLGCDLTKPHTMLLIEMVLPEDPAGTQRSRDPAPMQDRISMIQANDHYRYEENLSGGNLQIGFKYAAQIMKHRLQEHYPGSVMDQRGNRLYCIMPLDTSRDLHTWLCDIMHQIQLEQHTRMFFGIGNSYVDIHDYRKGFAEAEEALRIGQHLKNEGGGTHFNDLGVYRYIYEFACLNKVDDLYLEQIAALTSYDQQRKGSELLDTLEIFLEVGGNIKDTSERLQVHRNTIIQRLKRIQSLSAIDLEQPNQRLRLQIALMIDKLRKH